MKEAVDRFIETVVVGLFLAPFLWLALVLVFGLVAWLLMVFWACTTRAQGQISAYPHSATG